MALYMLEASIAWDKSIMKAVSLTTARNSVCVKLRNRCVSLKATNQYNQLLTTSQASVGIRTNLLTEVVLCYPLLLKRLCPLPFSQYGSQRAYVASNGYRQEKGGGSLEPTTAPLKRYTSSTRQCSCNTSAFSLSSLTRSSDCIYTGYPGSTRLG